MHAGDAEAEQNVTTQGRHLVKDRKVNCLEAGVRGKENLDQAGKGFEPILLQ